MWHEGRLGRYYALIAGCVDWHARLHLPLDRITGLLQHLTE
jgi:hypothetical protein